jgi:ATP-dependent DNA ligase
MIQAELLTEATEAAFKRMLTDPRFGFQEKHNGHRLVICKTGGQLAHFNRIGEPSSKRLPSRVHSILLQHPLENFVIDTELVGEMLYIFDALYLGEEELVHDAYEYREARYHAEFTGFAYIIPVKTARTFKEKKELWQHVLDINGEGLCAKNMTKAYRMGRADQHFKLKFWKTADAIVIGQSPDHKDGIDIGMYDAKGRLHRISGCSMLVKAARKRRPQPGDVIEVRFLYATKERHIVQPTLLSVRFDKKAAECKLTQLEPYINKNWAVTK